MKVTATISEEHGEALQRLSAVERRRVTNQAAILLERAIDSTLAEQRQGSEDRSLVPV